MRLLFFADRASGRDARRLIDRAMGAPFPAVRATEGVHIEPAIVGDRWCRLRRVRGQTQWVLFVDDAMVATADVGNDALLRTRVIRPDRRTTFRSLIASAAEIAVDICDDDDDADPGTIDTNV